MTTSTQATTNAVTSSQIELAIGGMTCASCASRIERKLNKLDGVNATVNFATERAKVSFPAGLPPDELVKTVEAVGGARCRERRERRSFLPTHWTARLSIRSASAQS